MEGPSSHEVAAGGLTFHYLEQGKGQPLILLHGGLATAEMSWNECMPELAKTYRVLAPDSRGHGGTDNPAQKLSYSQMADDLAAFIAALGVEQPLIFGYSDGGQIGIEFGIRHPNQAKALVLGGTLSERTDAYVDGLHKWGFPAPGEVDFERLATQFGAFAETIKVSHGKKEDPDYWRRFLPQISELWLTLPSYSEAQIASIAVPTLVIMGDRDDMAGGLGQAQRLYRHLPKGELAIVPDADHGAIQKPVFWALVREFLARQM